MTKGRMKALVTVRVERRTRVREGRMVKALFLACLVVLWACAEEMETVSIPKIRGPDGKLWYEDNCQNGAECLEDASKTCGDRGYDVLNAGGNNDVHTVKRGWTSGASSRETSDTSSTITMLWRCKPRKKSDK
jgi:hypothetical protein